MRGLGPVAEAQIVFGKRLAQQHFVSSVAAGGHLVDKRLEELDGLLEIVGAVGQDAAIELRLVRGQLIELRLHAKVLVIGEQVAAGGHRIERPLVVPVWSCAPAPGCCAVDGDWGSGAGAWGAACCVVCGTDC